MKKAKKTTRQKRQRRADKGVSRRDNRRPDSLLNEKLAAPLALNAQNIVQYPSTMSMWEHKRASTPGGMRIKGREPIGTMIATATTSTGAFQNLEISTATGVGSFCPLNPFMFQRLHGIAEIFDQFKFHSVVIDVIPYKPTTTAGTYFGRIDTDPADTWDGPITNSGDYLNSLVNFLASIYSVARMVYTGDLAQLPRYLCSAVDEAVNVFSPAGDCLSEQGNIEFGCQGVNTTDGESLATVMVTYDVEFFNPSTLRNDPPVLTRAELYRARKFNPGVKDIESLRAIALATRLRSDPKFFDVIDKAHQVLCKAREELKKEKEVESTVSIEKRKFDPQCSDGDIPNVEPSVDLPLSSDQRSRIENGHLHLKLGDGGRYYRLSPRHPNRPVDLWARSADIKDPFYVPGINEEFEGVLPRFYEPCCRINYCPCGCNDPSHDVCELCGSEENCCGEVIPEWELHPASLDPRSSYRTMSIEDFYKCCTAIWSVLDNDDDSRALALDWMESPLCQWTTCTPMQRHSVITASHNFSCGEHLCCLTADSLRELAELVFNRRFPKEMLSRRSLLSRFILRRDGDFPPGIQQMMARGEIRSQERLRQLLARDSRDFWQRVLGLRRGALGTRSKADLVSGLTVSGSFVVLPGLEERHIEVSPAVDYGLLPGQ